MTPSERTVVIEQLPESCAGNASRELLQRLRAQIDELVRPAVVLDCSRVKQSDKQVVHLLFSCLEEALKRNGDVRLAAVRPDAWPALQAAGVGRLFRIFPSHAEAASSYRKSSAYSYTAAPAGASQSAANAA